MSTPFRSFVRAAAAALATILGAAAPAASQTPAPIPVHVTALPGDDVTSVIYAIHAGLFAKAGLDVTYEKAASGGAFIAAVASGAYDIGKASLTPILDAHDKGVPFVLVAPAGVYDDKLPYAGLLVSLDSPLHAGKDFTGKVVSASTLNDIGQVATDAWIDQHGGDWRTVRYIEVPMTAVGAALEAHRIDAGEAVNPPLAAVMATGKVRMIPTYGAIAPQFLLSAWFTTADWAKSHAEVVKTFARVVAQAAAYTNAHHAETAPLIADLSGIPVATIEHMTRVTDGTTLNPALLQPVIDAAAKYGAIKRAYRAQELISTALF
jgi:ABC-type nitrate/sulfonate/bicarbonate transport system substrate-binding protein